MISRLAVLAALALSSASDDPTVVNLSAFGRAGFGGDDTSVFQRAIGASALRGAILRIPAGRTPYRVKPLFLADNTRMHLDPGVVVEALPGYEPLDKMINIVDVSRVEIVGPGAVFRMRSREYSSGEYRHCLNIQGAADVRIDGVSCNDSGGDGLYIGATDSRPYSRNIVVENAAFHHNRRQGVSIISASGVWIRRCRFTGTRGTEPANGVDLEPNSPLHRLENIHFEDSVAEDNAGDGLGVSVVRLDRTSAPVSVTVRNFQSRRNGRAGFLVANDENPRPPVGGTILFSRCTSESDATYGAVASFYDARGPAVTFEDLTVIDANSSRSTYDNAAVAVKRGGGGVTPLGNIAFLRATIIDTTGALDYYFTFRDYSNVGFEKVRFLNPVKLAGARRSPPDGLIQGQAANSVDQ